MKTVLIGVLMASLSGCIVFDDRAGEPVTAVDAAAILPGQTTREEVLQRLGPPTGYYTMDLEAVVTRAGDPLQAGWAPTRADDDVFAYQQVNITGNIAFFPILFTRVRSSVLTRTLVVFFDEAGVVKYVSFREDQS